MGLHDLTNKFKGYIKEFVNANIGYSESNSYIENTLSNLLGKYNSVRTRFLASGLMNEWKMLMHFFEIPNPKNKENIKKEQKHARDVYRFFYHMSSFQFKAVEELINFISGQLLPIIKMNQDLTPSLNKQIIGKPNLIYIFRIKEEFLRKKSSQFLSALHRGLKQIGYIDCTLPIFKRLFINFKDIKPSETPQPVVWMGEHYNHLAYIIKCISGTFLSRPKSPSNNKIAINLFYNNIEGKYFTPSKLRFDFNLNPTDKEIINGIVKESWSSIV
jgi:hypothetical protein